MTTTIDGIEYVELETVNNAIKEQLGAHSDDINDEIDISTLKERHARIQDELTVKQNEHDQKQRDKDLAAHVNKYYGTDLKDVNSFIELCKTRNAYDDDDIHATFKLIPRSAKKNIVQKFLKI